MDVRVCPRCAGTLAADSIGACQVGMCTGCGGMWVDHQELDKLVKAQASEPARKLPAAQNPRAASMYCQRCRVALEIVKRDGVEIDVCRTCKGVWLDKGELDRLSAVKRGDVSEKQVWLWAILDFFT